MNYLSSNNLTQCQFWTLNCKPLSDNKDSFIRSCEVNTYHAFTDYILIVEVSNYIFKLRVFPSSSKQAISACAILSTTLNRNTLSKIRIILLIGFLLFLWNDLFIFFINLARTFLAIPIRRLI